MGERVALEDERVGFQLSDDNLAIKGLLLVEGPIGAYVVDDTTRKVPSTVSLNK